MFKQFDSPLPLLEDYEINIDFYTSQAIELSFRILGNDDEIYDFIYYYGLDGETIFDEITNTYIDYIPTNDVLDTSTFFLDNWFTFRRSLFDEILNANFPTFITGQLLQITIKRFGELTSTPNPVMITNVWLGNFGPQRTTNDWINQFPINAVDLESQIGTDSLWIPTDYLETYVNIDFQTSLNAINSAFFKSEYNRWTGFVGYRLPNIYDTNMHDWITNIADNIIEALDYLSETENYIFEEELLLMLWRMKNGETYRLFSSTKESAGFINNYESCVELEIGGVISPLSISILDEFWGLGQNYLGLPTNSPYNGWTGSELLEIELEFYDENYLTNWLYSTFLADDYYQGNVGLDGQVILEGTDNGNGLYYYDAFHYGINNWDIEDTGNLDGTLSDFDYTLFGFIAPDWLEYQRSTPYSVVQISLDPECKEHTSHVFDYYTPVTYNPENFDLQTFPDYCVHDWDILEGHTMRFNLRELPGLDYQENDDKDDFDSGAGFEFYYDLSNNPEVWTADKLHFEYECMFSPLTRQTTNIIQEITIFAKNSPSQKIVTQKPYDDNSWVFEYDIFVGDLLKYIRLSDDELGIQILFKIDAKNDEDPNDIGVLQTTVDNVYVYIQQPDEPITPLNYQLGLIEKNFIENGNFEDFYTIENIYGEGINTVAPSYMPIGYTPIYDFDMLTSPIFVPKASSYSGGISKQYSSGYCWNSTINAISSEYQVQAGFKTLIDFSHYIGQFEFSSNEKDYYLDFNFKIEDGAYAKLTLCAPDGQYPSSYSIMGNGDWQHFSQEVYRDLEDIMQYCDSIGISREAELRIVGETTESAPAFSLLVDHLSINALTPSGVDSLSVDDAIGKWSGLQATMNLPLIGSYDYYSVSNFYLLEADLELHFSKIGTENHGQYTIEVNLWDDTNNREIFIYYVFSNSDLLLGEYSNRDVIIDELGNIHYFVHIDANNIDEMSAHIMLNLRESLLNLRTMGYSVFDNQCFYYHSKPNQVDNHILTVRATDQASYLLLDNFTIHGKAPFRHYESPSKEVRFPSYYDEEKMFVGVTYLWSSDPSDYRFTLTTQTPYISLYVNGEKVLDYLEPDDWASDSTRDVVSSVTAGYNTIMVVIETCDFNYDSSIYYGNLFKLKGEYVKYRDEKAISEYGYADSHFYDAVDYSYSTFLSGGPAKRYFEQRTSLNPTNEIIDQLACMTQNEYLAIGLSLEHGRINFFGNICSGNGEETQTYLFLRDLLTGFATMFIPNNYAKESLINALTINTYTRIQNELWDEYDGIENVDGCQSIEKGIQADSYLEGIHAEIDVNLPGLFKETGDYSNDMRGPQDIVGANAKIEFYDKLYDLDYIRAIMSERTDSNFDVLRGSLYYASCYPQDRERFDVLLDDLGNYLTNVYVHDNRLYDDAFEYHPDFQGDWYDEMGSPSDSLKWTTLWAEWSKSDFGLDFYTYYPALTVLEDDEGNYYLEIEFRKNIDYDGAGWGTTNGWIDPEGFEFHIYSPTKIIIEYNGLEQHISVPTNNYNEVLVDAISRRAVNEEITWSEMWLLISQYITFRSETGTVPRPLDMFNDVGGSALYAYLNTYDRRLANIFNSIEAWKEIYYENLADELIVELLDESIIDDYSIVNYDDGSLYEFVESLSDEDILNYLNSESKTLPEELEYYIETSGQSAALIEAILRFYLARKMIQNLSMRYRSGPQRFTSTLGEQLKRDSVINTVYAKDHKLFMRALQNPAVKRLLIQKALGTFSDFTIVQETIFNAVRYGYVDGNYVTFPSTLERVSDKIFQDGRVELSSFVTLGAVKRENALSASVDVLSYLAVRTFTNWEIWNEIINNAMKNPISANAWLSNYMFGSGNDPLVDGQHRPVIFINSYGSAEFGESNALYQPRYISNDPHLFDIKLSNGILYSGLYGSDMSTFGYCTVPRFSNSFVRIVEDESGYQKWKLDRGLEIRDNMGINPIFERVINDVNLHWMMHDLSGAFGNNPYLQNMWGIESRVSGENMQMVTATSTNPGGITFGQVKYGGSPESNGFVIVQCNIDGYNALMQIPKSRADDFIMLATTYEMLGIPIPSEEVSRYLPGHHEVDGHLIQKVNSQGEEDPNGEWTAQGFFLFSSDSPFSLRTVGKHVNNDALGSETDARLLLLKTATVIDYSQLSLDGLIKQGIFENEFGHRTGVISIPRKISDKYRELENAEFSIEYKLHDVDAIFELLAKQLEIDVLFTHLHRQYSESFPEQQMTDLRRYGKTFLATRDTLSHLLPGKTNIWENTDFHPTLKSKIRELFEEFSEIKDGTAQNKVSIEQCRDLVIELRKRGTGSLFEYFYKKASSRTNQDVETIKQRLSDDLTDWFDSTVENIRLVLNNQLECQKGQSTHRLLNDYNNDLFKLTCQEGLIKRSNEFVKLMGLQTGIPKKSFIAQTRIEPFAQSISSWIAFLIGVFGRNPHRDREFTDQIKRIVGPIDVPFDVIDTTKLVKALSRLQAALASLLGEKNRCKLYYSYSYDDEGKLQYKTLTHEGISALHTVISTALNEFANTGFYPNNNPIFWKMNWPLISSIICAFQETTDQTRGVFDYWVPKSQHINYGKRWLPEYVESIELNLNGPLGSDVLLSMCNPNDYLSVVTIIERIYPNTISYFASTHPTLKFTYKYNNVKKTVSWIYKADASEIVRNWRFLMILIQEHALWSTKTDAEILNQLNMFSQTGYSPMIKDLNCEFLFKLSLSEDNIERLTKWENEIKGLLVQKKISNQEYASALKKSLEIQTRSHRCFDLMNFIKNSITDRKSALMKNFDRNMLKQFDINGKNDFLSAYTPIIVDFDTIGNNDIWFSRFNDDKTLKTGNIQNDIREIDFEFIQSHRINGIYNMPMINGIKTIVSSNGKGLLSDVQNYWNKIINSAEGTQERADALSELWELINYEGRSYPHEVYLMTDIYELSTNELSEVGKRFNFKARIYRIQIPDDVNDEFWNEFAGQWHTYRALHLYMEGVINNPNDIGNTNLEVFEISPLKQLERLKRAFDNNPDKRSINMPQLNQFTRTSRYIYQKSLNKNNIDFAQNLAYDGLKPMLFKNTGGHEDGRRSVKNFLKQIAMISFYFGLAALTAGTMMGSGIAQWEQVFLLNLHDDIDRYSRKKLDKLEFSNTDTKRNNFVSRLRKSFNFVLGTSFGGLYNLYNRYNVWNQQNFRLLRKYKQEALSNDGAIDSEEAIMIDLKLQEACHVKRILSYYTMPGISDIANMGFRVFGKINTLTANAVNYMSQIVRGSVTGLPNFMKLQKTTLIALDLGFMAALVMEINTGYDPYYSPLQSNKGGIIWEYGKFDTGEIVFTLGFLTFLTDYIEWNLPLGSERSFDIFEYINCLCAGFMMSFAIIGNNINLFMDLTDATVAKEFIVDYLFTNNAPIEEDTRAYRLREKFKAKIMSVPDIGYKVLMFIFGAYIMMSTCSQITTLTGGLIACITSFIGGGAAMLLWQVRYARIGKEVVWESTEDDLNPDDDDWDDYFQSSGTARMRQLFTENELARWGKDQVSQKPVKRFFKKLANWRRYGYYYQDNEDFDNDLLDDNLEIEQGTDWRIADTDGDFVADGLEYYGYSYEDLVGFAPPELFYLEGVDYQQTDPLNDDHDEDGIKDGIEYLLGSNPLNEHSDSDGIPDGEEYLEHGSSPAKSDTDDDGILDNEEIIEGEDGFITDPSYFDTDMDGVSDLEEIYAFLDFNANRQIDTGEAHGKGQTDPTNPDCDGDGLLDGNELVLYGTDPNNPDSDGDGVGDYYEVMNQIGHKEGYSPPDPNVADANVDHDGDGLDLATEYSLNTKAYEVINNELTSQDSDRDGLTDFEEVSLDAYGAYGLDPNNPDSDNDGLLDGLEIIDIYTGEIVDSSFFDIDGDGLSIFDDPDSDNDGLYDGMEYWFGTSQFSTDTDGDGISDYDEITTETTYITKPLLLDSDGDGLTDNEEIFGISYLHYNGTMITVYLHPNRVDSDFDGITDNNEIIWQLDPTDAMDGALDLDSDGLTNQEEISIWSTNPHNSDTDADLLPDGWEVSYDLDPNDDGTTIFANGALGDYDNDDLTNYYEYTIGTIPNNPDTESDGMPDGWEDAWGLNPLVNDASIDHDNDGYYENGIWHSFTNGQEYMAGTNPYNDDWDGDQLLDGFEHHYGLDPKSNVGNDGTYGDYDNDHVINLDEQTMGTNPNGVLDEDDDFLCDDWEQWYFGDIATYDLDDDPDGDGLDNINEWVYYANPLSTDTDSDTLNDYDEVMIHGTDPTGDDTDNDGLSDGLEIDQYGTNAVDDDDSDDDGLLDGEEHHIYGTHPGDPDSDNDLLDDYEEVFAGADGYITNPNSADTDNDGIDDKEEVELGTDGYYTNPTNPDSDGDGVDDLEETTPGSDGYTSNPTVTDSDGDNLDDFEETYAGTDGYITNPMNADTDGDLLDDYEETITYNTDPTDGDTDNDNLTDYQEITIEGTNPNDADTDNDGYNDGYECAPVRNWDPLDTFDPITQPENVEVIQQSSSSQLVIDWDGMNGVSQYKVEYKYNGESTWHEVYTTSSSITLTGLLAGTEYLILVYAQSNYNGDWSSGNYEFGWTRQPAPTTPTTSLSNYVDITVNYYLSDDATHLELYRKIDSGGWSLYATYTSSGCVVFTGCPEDTTYSFYTRQRIAAAGWTDTYWSPISATASRTTIHQPEPTPGSCGSLYGFSDYNTKITFTWGQPGNFQSGWYYKLYRGSTLIRTSSSRSYTYTPPSPTTTYTYKVTCFNNDGIHGSYSYRSIKVRGGGGGGPFNEGPEEVIVKIDNPVDQSKTRKRTLTIMTIILPLIIASTINYLSRYEFIPEESIKQIKKVRRR
ncbi:MAG: hypothetical protein E3J70_08650 [Candidatus Heimdallarchaeota archaeon]|nr:MAG: hypothetical protein E3J70_08650 [Candidatus Heimdallarchaeota archaeon]